MRFRLRPILTGPATLATLLAASALLALGLSKARDLAAFAEEIHSKCYL